MGKTAVAIDLTPGERRELESLASRRRTAQGCGKTGAHRAARGGRRGEQEPRLEKRDLCMCHRNPRKQSRNPARNPRNPEADLRHETCNFSS